ncbi:MAG: Rne/Rng family ribonuclease [Rhodospirillaceae bacterium]
MAKRMLVDATQPEETRVVVVNGNRLEDLDFEIASRKQLKGNIYLAKVTRVEPSLQAAFIEYGGNRHGFLAFSEIHPDYYRIPVADREALLAEERRLAELADEDEDEAPRRRGRNRGRAAPAPVADLESGEEGDGTADAAPAQDAADHAEPFEVVEAGASDADRRDEGGHDEDDSADDEAGHQEAGAAADDDSDSDGDDSDDDDGDHGGDDTAGPGKVMASVIPVDQVSDDAAPESATDGEDAEGADAPEFADASPAPADAGPEPELHGAEAQDAPEPIRLDVIGGDETDEEEMVRRRPRPLRSYKIQEVIKRRQILLVQVTKEERGTKGAALTTYLSLPGRYCVLMPNTGRGGGVSRKITNPQDRKRLKDMLSDLDIPQGMAVILRTAGLERSKAEIKRDLEYLLRLWDSIREQTLQSTAPELIYEEANLIKRSIRDLYTNDIDEVLVEGETGYRVAKDFMRMLVPSHSKRVQPYRDETIPLFFRYQVESQIDAIHSPVVQLKSGGYIVINQTEALVAIDVNSGRSTRERNIEETAYKTNLEAADEVARQLRLRDLAGLIVIDFIDMEDSRNNASVERRLKEAMKSDRARIQLGRISPFGLLELSRQRLRPSLLEANFEKCPHCSGLGVIRSIESAALHALRAIEEEGIRRRSSEITVALPSKVALYILNAKREELALVEARYGLRVIIQTDESLIVPDLRIERVKARLPGEEAAATAATERVLAEPERRTVIADDEDDEIEEEPAAEVAEPRQSAQAEPAAGGERPGDDSRDRRGGRRGRRGRRRQGGERPGEAASGVVQPMATVPLAGGEDSDEGGESGESGGVEAGEAGGQPAQGAGDGADGQARKRRRGKRGGRRRGRNRFDQTGAEGAGTEAGATEGAEGFDAEGFDGEDYEAGDLSADTEAGDDEGEAAAGVTPTAAPLPLAAVEVVDFDWLLDVERPGVDLAVPLTTETDAAEAVVASTEGDEVATALAGTAAEPAAPEAEAPAPAGVRKRPSRRRSATEATEAPADGEAAAPAKRPSRRRTKSSAADEALAPAEIAATGIAAAEVAPEAAAEIMPEPAPDSEPAPTAEGVPEFDDAAAIAPTERPDDVPPAPAVILADAPLPAPTRESVTDVEAPAPAPVEPPAPAGPAKRGWWSRK